MVEIIRPLEREHIEQAGTPPECPTAANGSHRNASPATAALYRLY
jgi:hypothetical protein